MNYQTLNLLIRSSKQFSHRKLREQELSETECMLCSYIFSHTGCSQEETVQALKTEKSTVTKALDALERKQFVLRTKDTADKRINRLSLTEKGKEKVSTLVDLHDQWLREIFTCLSEKEQRQFGEFCERLLAAAGELAEKQMNEGALK